MSIRNLSAVTQRCYLHAVTSFSRHFNCSPDRLGLTEVRAYQVHLVSTGVSWQAFNQTISALRFFYGVTLSWRPVSSGDPATLILSESDTHVLADA